MANGSSVSLPVRRVGGFIMLSEKYCQNLEMSISSKKRQIKKLKSDKFILELLMGVGWGLFILSQLRYAMLTWTGSVLIQAM